MKRGKKLLLIIFCFMLSITIVKADYSDGTESGGGSNNAGKGCSGTDSCWISTYYGARVHLYSFDKNKAENKPTNKIGKTIDYVGQVSSSYYTSSGQLTRYNILDGSNPSFSNSHGNQIQASSWLRNMYENAGNFPTDIEKKVMGACYKKTKADYGNDNEKYLKAIQECMRPFFSEMGAEAELNSFIEGLLNSKDTGKDIFIVYEPICYVRVTGKGEYFITGTELSWMVGSPNYSVGWVTTLVSGKPSQNHVSATAYQPSKKIAGFNPFNLASNTLPKADHNSSSKYYGVSVGVARLSEIANINPTQHKCEVVGNEYYGKNGNKVTKSVYDQECGNNSQICTFDLVKKIVNDCKNGTEGYVKDIDDWDCIFESRKSSNNTIKNYFYTNVENRYCSIFCREEVYYYFPGSSLTVRAGNHFSLGNTGAPNTLLPVNMTGRSECRVNYGTAGGTTGKINYEQFKKDWTNINSKIPSAWNSLNIELAKSDSIKNATRSSYRNCAYYCDHNVHGLECCSSADRDWDDCKYGSPCGRKDSNNNCIDTCRGGWGPWYCVVYDTPYNHGYWYTPSYEYYNGSYYQANGWCSDCGNRYTSETCSSSTNLSSAVSYYNNLLQTRNNYLTQLLQCNNFQRTYKDFKPELQFKYDEGEYEKLNYNYSYSDTLLKKLTIKAQTNYFRGNSNIGIHTWDTSSYENSTVDILLDKDVPSLTGSKSLASYHAYRNKYSSYVYPTMDYSSNSAGKTYGSRATIKGYKCDTFRSNCNYSSVDVTYPANDWLRMFTTKEYNYSLRNGVYNYVRKDNGQSLSYAPTGGNYYVVGYSNLPTHYSRKTRSDYHFYLDFSLEVFGVNQKFYKFMKLGYNTGITYGQESIVTIYEKLWNNSYLNNLINDCYEGGTHLSHSFVRAINNYGISTSDFLSTPCAKQYSCRLVGSSKVSCSGDILSHWDYSRNYQQLRACIKEQVVDRVGSPAFTDTDYTYKCTYTIKNEIVCPPDSGCSYIGLSAIYRTINLNNPFPNRRPGPNWTSVAVNKYITNNRNANTSKIYSSRGPLYKITLTPRLIASIKNYNTTHDMSDYNMNCNSAGKECKSNFIRSTYSYAFSGCGISGKGTGSCAAGEAW